MNYWVIDSKIAIKSIKYSIIRLSFKIYIYKLSSLLSDNLEYCYYIDKGTYTFLKNYKLTY